MGESRFAVVGAGVNGLACAHELASLGSVVVHHDRALLETTSALATAIWHVYLVDPTDHQHLDWSRRTLERLLDHADEPEAGVELCEGVELFRSTPRHRPPWADIAPGFRMLSVSELEEFPGRAWGYRIMAPVADMHRYLAWLHGRCLDRGVTFESGHVDSLVELAGEYEAVVNCAGLEARKLVDDPELFPTRGEYIVLKPGLNPPTTYVGDDEHEDGMAYMIPRGGEVMVGGTAEPNEWALKFQADPEDILRRASLFLDQDLTDLTEIRRVVCLRPCRRSQRVRFGRDSDCPSLVHNYGHGGSGFSLCWGCAEDICQLLASSVDKESQ